MFCTQCGKQIPDDSLFCVHCGKKVMSAHRKLEEQKAQAAKPAPVSQPELPASARPQLQAQKPAQSAPVPQKPKKRKNRGIDRMKKKLVLGLTVLFVALGSLAACGSDEKTAEEATGLETETEDVKMEAGFYWTVTPEMEITETIPEETEESVYYEDTKKVTQQTVTAVEEATGNETEDVDNSVNELEAVPEGTELVFTEMYTTDRVNMRVQPTTEARIYKTVEAHTVVQAVDKVKDEASGNEWCRIVIDNNYCYIASRYLKEKSEG